MVRSIFLIALLLRIQATNGLSFQSMRKALMIQSRKVLGSSAVLISSVSPLAFPKSREQSVVSRQLSTAFGNPSHKLVPDQRRPRESTSFVRSAVKSVGQSVVRIDCEREVTQLMTLFSDNFREGDSVKISGTGIIASTNGYILTNAHVVDQAKKVTVTLSNDRTYKASVIACDEFTDLAVIKAEIGSAQNKLVRAPIGDSSSLQAGDWVIAVGCPVGLDFTVTLGVVSSPRRSAFEIGAPHLKGSYIQTDAALNSGNSGGPLVNEFGQVIGINTMVRVNTEAIGFAIPINRAAEIYEVLKSGRKPTHAFFGIEVSTITPDFAKINNEDPNLPRLPEIHGALVSRVVPGSPADGCGIRKNDVIIGINAEDINNSNDADINLDRCKPGRVSSLKVARGEQGKHVDIDVTPQDLHKLLEERMKKQQPFVVMKPSVPSSR